MFILFGYRIATKIMSWLAIWCPACQEQTMQAVIQRRRWFTLFFIPVIPFHGRKQLVCDICGNVRPWAQVNAERQGLIEGLAFLEANLAASEEPPYPPVPSPEEAA